MGLLPRCYNQPMTALSQHTIEEALAAIAPSYAIERVYLFGSCARDCADGSSDIDLCIEPSGDFTLFSLGGFGQNLEDRLGCSIDLVCDADSFYPRARQRFENDKVLVYARS